MKITDVRNQLAYRDTAPHRPINTIKYIVIHHDAVEVTQGYDPLARYKSEANFHYNKDWNGDGKADGSGLMYNYKIDYNGDIYFCRNLGEALWHCGNYQKNLESIAVCLDGHLTNSKPSRAQLVSLAEFLRGLCTQHPEFPADFKDIFGHREISATNCPGDNLIKFVQDFREKKGQINVDDYPHTPSAVESPPEEPQTPEIETPCPEIENYSEKNHKILVEISPKIGEILTILNLSQKELESARKRIVKLETEIGEIDEERKNFQRLYKEKLDNDIGKATRGQILSALLSRFNPWKNGR